MRRMVTTAAVVRIPHLDGYLPSLTFLFAYVFERIN
jgi:hypothetical protein